MNALFSWQIYTAGKNFLDRRSWRSRQISTIVWLSQHHMRHSSTTARVKYVLFPNIYISGSRCHQPLHPASRWPGLPSTQSIPAPHWGAWHHGTMPPKKVCTLPQHISRQLVHPRSSSPSPPLTWGLDTRKNVTINGKQQNWIFVQERDLWKLNLCAYHQDAFNILYEIIDFPCWLTCWYLTT